MRPRHFWWGSMTALGFVPALVMLWIANWMHNIFGWVWIWFMRWPSNQVMANQVANTWLLGVVAGAYVLWILAVARRWVTTATGGGFVIAAHALILRIIVELPQSMAQVPLAEQVPPEPYLTALLFGRVLGLVGYAAGLGAVLAATISERRLRRAGPAWALPA